MKVHTISYTPLDAPGGVPRFNRYLHKVLQEGGFEVKHWSWWDLPAHNEYMHLREDLKAQSLSRYLISKRLVEKDDFIIGDGFWCGDFAFLGYRRIISVAHGIWGHVTKDDVDSGVLPENPELHAAQIAHRLDHQRRGLPIVAVSRFIQNQMQLQWDIDSTVINNSIDPEEIEGVGPPASKWDDDVFIVHGVNDRSNRNKGWDHIEQCINAVRERDYPTNIQFFSLDELHGFLGAEKLGMSKMWSLQHADLAIIPSGYEGNSYWALELLTSGVPVVAYDVGLFWELSRVYQGDSIFHLNDWDRDWVYDFGIVAPRSERSPETTALMVNAMLMTGKIFWKDKIIQRVNDVASFEAFRLKWIDKIESMVLVEALCR